MRRVPGPKAQELREKRAKESLKKGVTRPRLE